MDTYLFTLSGFVDRFRIPISGVENISVRARKTL